ncbi:MAG TPA: molecular chaperone HscC, partial [Planctomycetes bacterium]|nr:molecular chaperone HscC [Planctomycetota bacterium]
LGGGTFDVTLMEIFEGALEITSTAGEGQLGGEDFTDRLTAWSLREQGMNIEIAEMTHPLRVARLRVECELAKRRLSESDSAAIRMPNDEGRYDDDPPSVQIDRETFKTESKRLLDRLEAPL